MSSIFLRIESDMSIRKGGTGYASKKDENNYGTLDVVNTILPEANHLVGELTP